MRALYNNEPKPKPSRLNPQADEQVEERLKRYASPEPKRHEDQNGKADTRHTLESEDQDEGYLWDDDDVAC